MIEGVEGLQAEIQVLPLEGQGKTLLMARVSGSFLTPEIGLRGVLP
jgi:hypothetical protein